MNWDRVKYFKEEDFRPCRDPQGRPISSPLEYEYLPAWAMNPVLIYKLDEIRERCGYRCYVSFNGGFSFSGHSATSLHNSGRAVDFHFRDLAGKPLTWLKQALIVRGMIDERFGFGVYPWSHTGFIHLDYREGDERGPACWYRDKDGKYHDFHFDWFDLCLESIFKEVANG